MIFNMTVAGVLACGGVTLQSAAVFDVDVSSPELTLYTDPYNGNQIKVGGFSGIYPVAGDPNLFYVVTDRGPAPDFVDADGTTFKAFATPKFGPHILTVRLGTSGAARI